ncbi:purine-cytosine permease family protein [Gordonia sp. DT219]|uniref:purine-cytosine permease family protein n=1 Tax=Gordonia sp. DT219 TaxID=3416658 RepID=UPI003CF77A24
MTTKDSERTSAAIGGPIAQSAEDYAAVRVPPAERQSTLDISLVRMGLTVSASDLVFGYTLGLYFGFWQAVTISLVISLIVLAISVGMGAIGVRERLTLALATRFAFGRQGSRLPSLVTAIVIGLFYGYILAITISVFPAASSTVARVVYCVLLGGLFVLISGLGFDRGLKWMGRIGVPLMILLVIVADVVTIVDAGGFSEILSAHPAKSGQMAVLAIMGLGISKWTGGALVSPDITRFGKGMKSVWISTGAEFVLGNFAFNLLGLILGLGLKSSDLGAAFGLIGLTWLATVAFLFQGTTVSTNMLYAASLSSANVVGLPRKITNLVVGILGIVIAYWGLTQGVINSFLTFIGYIGYALPAIPAIILADYFILHKMRYSAPIESLPMVNWRAIAALIVTVGLNVFAGLVLDDEFWRVLPVLGAIVYLVFSAPQVWAAWRTPTPSAV